MRPLIIGLALFFSLANGCAGARADDPKLFRIHLQWENGQYFAPVTINGKVLRCVVDSGAAEIAIATSKSADMRLVISNFGKATGIGGQVNAINTNVEVAAAEGALIVVAEAQVADLPIDCLLGETFLRQFKSFAFIKEHDDEDGAVLLLR